MAVALALAAGQGACHVPVLTDVVALLFKQERPLAFVLLLQSVKYAGPSDYKSKACVLAALPCTIEAPEWCDVCHQAGPATHPESRGAPQIQQLVLPAGMLPQDQHICAKLAGHRGQPGHVRVQ